MKTLTAQCISFWFVIGNPSHETADLSVYGDAPNGVYQDAYALIEKEIKSYKTRLELYKEGDTSYDVDKYELCEDSTETKDLDGVPAREIPIHFPSRAQPTALLELRDRISDAMTRAGAKQGLAVRFVGATEYASYTVTEEGPVHFEGVN